MLLKWAKSTHSPLLHCLHHMCRCVTMIAGARMLHDEESFPLSSWVEGLSQMWDMEVIVAELQ